MLTVKEMNETYTKEILNWKYEKPYDFYNNEETDESKQELLDGSYRAIVNIENGLVGFFCIGKSAQVPIGHQYGVYNEKGLDIGLGMKPVLTGKGNGFKFLSFILNYIQNNSNPDYMPLRLSVATFNERARSLYKRLGFVEENEFDSGRAMFKTMVKRLFY